jgi:hypothetical protein
MAFRIAYVSRSLVGGLSPELLDIARVALSRNAAEGVAGALYFDRERFLQVLEGPEPAVRRIMASIGRDPRHAGLRVLLEGSAEGLLFPEGSTRFIDGAQRPRLHALAVEAETATPEWFGTEAIGRLAAG